MRALVLSGGGSKGSFQAGAVTFLARHATYSKGFDFIAGTSVGAINAAGLAMHNRAEFDKAAAWLQGMWEEKLDIWSKRFPPWISALWAPSIGTNTGLVKLLKKHLSAERVRASDVALDLTAVNLLDGKLRRFTKQDFGSDDALRAAVLASASFPVAFPPESIGSGYLTDGGVRDIAPLKPAIEAGADEIIVILTAATAGTEIVARSKVNTALEVALRVVEIMTHEIMLNDVHVCQKVNRRLASGEIAGGHGKRPIKISVIEPSAPLGDSLEFDPKVMKAQIQQGITDAQSSLGARVVT